MQIRTRGGKRREGSIVCEISMHGKQLKHVSVFNYLKMCEMNLVQLKIASWRKFAVAIRFLVNIRSIRVECVKILHVGLLVSVLICVNGTAALRK